MQWGNRTGSTLWLRITHRKEKGLEDSRVAFKSHNVDSKLATCTNGSTYKIYKEEGENGKSKLNN